MVDHAVIGDVSCIFNSIDQMNANYDRQRRSIVEERSAVDSLRQLIKDKQQETDQLDQVYQFKKSELNTVLQRLPLEEANLRNGQNIIVTLRRTNNLLNQQIQQLTRDFENSANKLNTYLCEAQQLWQSYQRIYESEEIFQSFMQVRTLQQQLKNATEEKEQLEKEISSHVSDTEFIVRMIRFSVECKALHQVLNKKITDKETNHTSEDVEEQIAERIMSQTSGGFSVNDVSMDTSLVDKQKDINPLHDEEYNDDNINRLENLEIDNSVSTFHNPDGNNIQDGLIPGTVVDSTFTNDDAPSDEEHTNTCSESQQVTATSHSTEETNASCHFSSTDVQHDQMVPISNLEQMVNKENNPLSVQSTPRSPISRKVARKTTTYKTYWLPLPDEGQNKRDQTKNADEPSIGVEKLKHRHLEQSLNSEENSKNVKTSNKFSFNSGSSAFGRNPKNPVLTQPLDVHSIKATNACYQVPRIKLRTVTRQGLKPLSLDLDKKKQHPPLVSQTQDIVMAEEKQELENQSLCITSTVLNSFNPAEVSQSDQSKSSQKQPGITSEKIVGKEIAYDQKASKLQLQPGTDSEKKLADSVCVKDVFHRELQPILPRHSTPKLSKLNSNAFETTITQADASLPSEPGDNTLMEMSFDLLPSGKAAATGPGQATGISLLFGAGDSNADHEDTAADFSFNFNTMSRQCDRQPSQTLFSFF